jgi:hypothetical protein
VVSDDREAFVPEESAMCESEPKFFVQHLLAEHQRLDAMLRETWSTIIQNRSPDADASAKDVELALRQVRDELVATLLRRRPVAV